MLIYPDYTRASMRNLLTDLIIVFLVVTVVGASAPLHAQARPIELPRVGKSFSQEQRNYFGLFPDIDDELSAELLTINDSTVRWVLHRSVQPDSTVDAPTILVPELTYYLGSYEDLKVDSLNASRQLLRFVVPSAFIHRTSEIEVELRDHAVVRGEVVYASDSTAVIVYSGKRWHADQPESNCVVIRYDQVLSYKDLSGRLPVYSIGLSGALLPALLPLRSVYPDNMNANVHTASYVGSGLLAAGLALSELGNDKRFLVEGHPQRFAIVFHEMIDQCTFSEKMPPELKRVIESRLSQQAIQAPMASTSTSRPGSYHLHYTFGSYSYDSFPLESLNAAAINSGTVVSIGSEKIIYSPIVHLRAAVHYSNSVDIEIGGGYASLGSIAPGFETLLDMGVYAFSLGVEKVIAGNRWLSTSEYGQRSESPFFAPINKIRYEIQLGAAVALQSFARPAHSLHYVNAYESVDTIFHVQSLSATSYGLRITQSFDLYLNSTISLGIETHEQILSSSTMRDPGVLIIVSGRKSGFALSDLHSTLFSYGVALNCGFHW